MNVWGYIGGNPVLNFDLLGLELISFEEGQRISEVARTWSGVPYYGMVVQGQVEIELIVLGLFGKSMRKQVILMNIQILKCFRITRVLSLFLIISLNRVMWDNGMVMY